MCGSVSLNLRGLCQLQLLLHSSLGTWKRGHGYGQGGVFDAGGGSGTLIMLELQDIFSNVHAYMHASSAWQWGGGGGSSWSNFFFLFFLTFLTKR